MATIYKMKTILALAVLAVIAVSTDSSAITNNARLNLDVGYITSADRVLLRTYVRKNAIANAVQYEDQVYRGNATTRIAAVQAYEVGATQFATARIAAGGIGQRNVTVRFTSARGRGYYYQLVIWGR